jgi:hypothetical protein
MRCPRCDFDNTSANAFCENCGTYLAADPQNPTMRTSADVSRASSTNPASNSGYMNYPFESAGYQGYAPNTLDQQPYEAPPPPPSNGHNIPIAPIEPAPPPPIAMDFNDYNTFGTQSQTYENQKVYGKQERKPSLAGRIIRGCIYFIALFVAGLGAFGAIDSINKSNLGSGIGIALLFGLLIAGTVIFFLVRRFQHIRFLQFLLGLFVSTGSAFVALIVVYAILGDFQQALPSFLLGIILLLYGLILAALAVW